ncbi:MAG: hypothetical protein K5945_05915 [Bacteroidaceae bacterium]|nr:hypothetical protein [Bacteroidaceae bacterium]
MFYTLLSVFALVGLVLSRQIVFSWLIVSFAGLYSLCLICRQMQNWWQGRASLVARRERLLRLLASLMAFFLTTGTALFLCAFQFEGTDSRSSVGEVFTFVNAEYLFRSIVCSLDLFMLDIDSNVLDGISDHCYLKGLISIQAVFSFSCTVALLISLVIARVRAWQKLHWRTKVDNAHNHLYIFFGMNEASRLLAKSIRKTEGARALIVMVEKSPVNDNDRGGWDSIVEMFTHREQSFLDAEELDASITFTETRLCDVDKDKLTNSDILGALNLITLRKLIQSLSAGVDDATLRIFFLDENEDENIRAVSTLAQDATINAGIGKITQQFYCHARRNGLNRVVEDVAVKRGLDVRIVDSAHLAVELLKEDDRNHPVCVLETDPDNPTTVKSAFHSLIVGFDEAGQDAFNFLYEFGAFVYSSASPTNERRSPFHCTIVDRNMELLEGYFHAFAPAVAEKGASDNVFIQMKQCDCRSEMFYSLLDEDFRKHINYVVIAVGNDEVGMTCAIRLFNLVRQSRPDLSRLRIYVRSYEPDKQDYMQKIAAHYNEGYNNDFRNQLSSVEREYYVPQDIIIPFGQMEQIYTYDMVVGERFVKEGKVFMEGYAKLKHETEMWDDRRQLLLGYKEKAKDEHGNKYIRDIPVEARRVSLDNIRSLRRKEIQDMANALHAGTKLQLLRMAFGADYDWAGFLGRYFEADGKTPRCEGKYNGIVYPRLTPRERDAVLNLARLEHLRWNASHELLGYVKAAADAHRCDERQRTHNCLRPWQELEAESIAVTKSEGWDADYQSYDFGVVDITLILHKGRLLSSSATGEAILPSDAGSRVR